MKDNNTLKLCDLNNKNTYYASEELVNEAKAKNATKYVNIAYTDYGGSFFDKVLISYFLKEHKDNIVMEKTSWNGVNAFIFGDIVEQLIKETNDYLLSFEDLEDYFINFEERELNNYIDGLIEDGAISDTKRDLAYDYLSENAHVETFGVDVYEQDLIKYCE